MSELSVGVLLDVVVKRIEKYGAWVDWNGRKGLVRIPDISWFPFREISEVVSVGQTIRVKILGFTPAEFADSPKGREEFVASLKGVQPDQHPWLRLDEFRPDTVVTGKVFRVTSYGAFVVFAPGVLGLVERSECPTEWKAGDEVRVQIRDINEEKREVRLTLAPGSPFWEDRSL